MVVGSSLCRAEQGGRPAGFGESQQFESVRQHLVRFRTYSPRQWTERTTSWQLCVPAALATSSTSGNMAAGWRSDACERDEVCLVLTNLNVCCWLCPTPSAAETQPPSFRHTEEEEQERRAQEELRQQAEANRETQLRAAVKQQLDDSDDDVFGPAPPPPLSRSADGDGDEELKGKEEDHVRKLQEMAPTSFGRQTKPISNVSGAQLLKRKRAGAVAPLISMRLPSGSAAVSAAAPMKLAVQSKISGHAEAAVNIDDASSVAEQSVSSAHDDGGDGGDSDSDSDDDNPHELPISHEATLEGHERVASALALDPPGARLVSGGYDYLWKLYAFAGMNSTMRSFRSKEPDEGHQIRHLRFDRRGNRFLCITGSAQAKVFDREGFDLAQSARGDMYLHDMRFTSGHVSAITDGHWSPIEDEVFVTSGQDGTVRFWNVETPKKNLHVAIYKNRQGLRQTINGRFPWQLVAAGVSRWPAWWCA